MKEKTKKFLTVALSIYLILLSFQIWGDLTKQIRSTKKSLNSMKQLVQAYPHMFYPNHFQDITTLSIKFRELQGNEELYYIDNQVFQFDVLQMAAAPTSLNSFEMKLPKSGHIVIANPDSKIENKNAQLFQNCKPNITGEFYSICFWEKQ